MEKYICNTCGYVYDPAIGDSKSNIEPGIPYAALPDDWVCPQCATKKPTLNQKLKMAGRWKFHWL